jgi:hypothetical protein
MAIKGIFLVTFLALIMGVAVMLLWNALIPDLFHGPVIGFWQSVGLFLLCHILFRGIGPHRPTHSWRREEFRKRFEMKFAGLSPDKREKFMNSWRHDFCCGPDDDTASPDGPAKANPGPEKS